MRAESGDPVLHKVTSIDDVFLPATVLPERESLVASDLVGQVGSLFDRIEALTVENQRIPALEAQVAALQARLAALSPKDSSSTTPRSKIMCPKCGSDHVQIYAHLPEVDSGEYCCKQCGFSWAA